MKMSFTAARFADVMDPNGILNPYKTLPSRG